MEGVEEQGLSNIDNVYISRKTHKPIDFLNQRSKLITLSENHGMKTVWKKS